MMSLVFLDSFHHGFKCWNLCYHPVGLPMPISRQCSISDESQPADINSVQPISNKIALLLGKFRWVNFNRYD